MGSSVGVGVNPSDNVTVVEAAVQGHVEKDPKSCRTRKGLFTRKVRWQLES